MRYFGIVTIRDTIGICHPRGRLRLGLLHQVSIITANVNIMAQCLIVKHVLSQLFQLLFGQDVFQSLA